MWRINFELTKTDFGLNVTRVESIFLYPLGWFKTPLYSQTEKLMAGTKFSDYLGLNHYKKAKNLKHFIHLRLANWPQSFGS